MTRGDEKCCDVMTGIETRWDTTIHDVIRCDVYLLHEDVRLDDLAHGV